MRRKVSTADLAHREYWTPEQAARVLGRGADYWRTAFDSGRVLGYTDTTNGRTFRYLCAESARQSLRVLVQDNVQAKPRKGREAYLAALRIKIQTDFPAASQVQTIRYKSPSVGATVSAAGQQKGGAE